MINTTVRIRSSLAAIRAAIATIPQEIVGNISIDTQEMFELLGVAILARIHNAFLIKSRGGTDDAGDRWAPLSPVTLALRSKKDGRSSVRTLLDKKRKRIERGDNRTPAQRRAQNIIKGGTRRRNRYDSGVRDDILVDTGALQESLSPWIDSPDKIFKVTRSGITIGTKRKGAMDHHTGVLKRNLPQRRLWPPTNKWPASWWKDITNEVVQAITDMIVEKVKGAK